MVANEMNSRIDLVKTMKDQFEEIKRSRDNIKKQYAAMFRIGIDSVKLPDVDELLNLAYQSYAKTQIALENHINEFKI